MTNAPGGLGRRVEFDQQSRLYTVASTFTLEQTIPRSYTWQPGVQLDQGSSGRCVAYAGSGEGGARPVVWPATAEFANLLYSLCCLNDQWPENDDGDINFGTSVLALMKVLKSLGFIPEYRWCGAGSGQALADFTLSLGYKGPIIVGVNWYSSMNTPRLDGHIIVDSTSGLLGGHAFYFYRVAIKWLSGVKPIAPTFADVDLDASRAWLMNSWGGICNGWMTLREVSQLLHEDGEAVVILKRQRTS